MESRKERMPSMARYPIFFLGLLVLIVGGIVGIRVNAPVNVDLVVGIVGFLLLLLSVAIR